MRRFVMLLLFAGTVAGYGSAIAQAMHGGQWGPHCSHGSESSP